MSNESMANLITDTPSDVAELLALANYQEKQILELKELVIQARLYVEYAINYSTPLSQKNSEEWLKRSEEALSK